MSKSEHGVHRISIVLHHKFSLTRDRSIKSVRSGLTRTSASKGSAPKTSLKQVFFGRFPDEEEERLYQEYMRKQKLKIIPAFVLITIIFLVSRLVMEAVTTASALRLARIGLHAVFIVITVFLLILLTCSPNMSTLATNLCVTGLWVLDTAAQMVHMVVQYRDQQPGGMVGWMQVLIFTTFVVVPWKLRHCVGMSVVISFIHFAELFFREEEDDLRDVLIAELTAKSLLFLGALALGILVFAFSERKQRRSFIESKKSHSIGYEIEKEHKEQKGLLQSVLPKYVANLMMRDIEEGAETNYAQFRKIYMQRFENVSILFADIVGFTAISSSVSAAELVKILNQLFATFDSLAYKYHQQRIKILGDCYYCVCGISKVDLRPDHAVLSIHMGMSMVDAIRNVQRSTGKDVTMRVGIHTGSVLAGVMGQKHWQYDVLGQQVILANHMESGGLPAKVHISQSTMSQLNGQFELEPGYGANRDDVLRLENVNTYFVKSILQAYPRGTLDANLPLLAMLKDDAARDQEDTAEASIAVEDQWSVTRSTHYTLKDALFDKNRSRAAMEKMNCCTTWFRDEAMEVRYRARRELFSGAGMGALGLVLLIGTLAKFCVLPRRVITIIVFIVAEVILIAMALVSSASLFKTKFIPQSVVNFGKSIERNRRARMIWGLCAIITLIVADSVMIIQCDVGEARERLKNESNVQLLSQDDPVCIAPVYFVYTVHLILLAISSVVHIEHMVKLVTILLCAVIYCICYIFVFGPIFDYSDKIIHADEDILIPSKYDQCVQLMSAAIAILLLNRKMEEISRRLFIWREEAEVKMEISRYERCKTEELIYNILPEHVARHFIGQRRSDMDLYHQSYDNVAVMFAACPNFHDFYNESDVNNQGLECLRLLNEIISDYDELLDKPRFSTKITKIKTVGPTYMAASGMVTNQDHQSATEGESQVSRWQHVDDLVQFALAMKEELRLINEQSFNTFLLRIGINHGPIVAGVIGVTKPHYDIWGNTVNVASRMESTCTPDHIQVVEETKDVLEEFGYYFQKRGRIHVKGKGELTTYFLVGQDESKTPSAAPWKTEAIRSERQSQVRWVAEPILVSPPSSAAQPGSVFRERTGSAVDAGGITLGEVHLPDYTQTQSPASSARRESTVGSSLQKKQRESVCSKAGKSWPQLNIKTSASQPCPWSPLSPGSGGIRVKSSPKTRRHQSVCLEAVEMLVNLVEDSGFAESSVVDPAAEKGSSKASSKTSVQSCPLSSSVSLEPTNMIQVLSSRNLSRIIDVIAKSSVDTPNASIDNLT